MPRPWQVLVVDDDPGWRFMVSVFLEPEDRVVLLAATSLGGALQLAGPPHPDAVIIDVEGRGEPDGLAVLFELRARWPEATIFVYTAEVSSAELALAVGADAVIDKATHPRTTVRLLALATDQRAGQEG